MSQEIFWLTLTTLMTGLFWIPYVLDRIVVRGLFPVLLTREAEDPADQSLWARRAARAHANGVENLVLFAAAVLTANVMHVSTAATRGAAEAYFFARLVHFVVYTIGIPSLRTLAFTAGWIAWLVIVIAILGAA